MNNDKQRKNKELNYFLSESDTSPLHRLLWAYGGCGALPIPATGGALCISTAPRRRLPSSDSGTQ